MLFVAQGANFKHLGVPASDADTELIRSTFIPQWVMPDGRSCNGHRGFQAHLDLGAGVGTKTRGEIIVRIIGAPTSALLRKGEEGQHYPERWHALGDRTIDSGPSCGWHGLLWGTHDRCCNPNLFGGNPFLCAKCCGCHHLQRATLALSVLSHVHGQGTGRPGQGGDSPSWAISSRRKSHSRGLLRVPHSGRLSASQHMWHRVPLGLAGSENSTSCHLTVRGARKCITRGLDRRIIQRAVQNITTEWDFKLKSEKLKSINKIK